MDGLAVLGGAGGRVKSRRDVGGGLRVRVPYDLNLLLESGHDLVIVVGELFADDLRHVTFVVVKLFDLGVQGILLQFELLGLLTEDFSADLGLQAKHVLLEENEEAAGAVELVNQLVAFLEELGGDRVLDVLGLALHPAIQIFELLVLDIELMQEVLLLLEEEVAAALELLLAVGDDAAAESLDCVVEVLLGEYDAGARSQRLHLRAPIRHLGEELLDGAKLLAQI